VAVDKVSILKIDKDCHMTKDWIQDYLWLILAVCRRYQVKVVSVEMCHSRRKGIHFYVEIAPSVKAEVANKLQFLLGVDWQRVGFNQARIYSNFNEWNKLFERPDCKLRTIYRTTESSRHVGTAIRDLGAVV